jgi:DNA mismatch endonuclease (patch repair protein)
MSAVKSGNTTPERILRSALHKSGLRYRLHEKKLPGRPDLVFPKYRAVIFINGCYWHLHGCYKSTIPKTNHEFWKKKLTTNKERDARNLKALKEMEWRVMIVWECAIKGKKSYHIDTMRNIVNDWLHSSIYFFEIPTVGGQSVAFRSP